MHYVIYCEDAPDSLEKRRSVRPAHLQRLQALKDSNRLIVAGPLLGDDNENPAISGIKGSVIIAEFPNLEDAKAWAAADPYVTHGVFETYEIRPWKWLVGTPENV